MAQPLKPEAPRSSPITTGNEQLEEALAGLNMSEDTIDDSSGFRSHGLLSYDGETRCCKGMEPTSKHGKKYQVVQMLLLILTPIVVLLGVSIYFIIDNINRKLNSAAIRQTVSFSGELGRLVHVIQKERDMSVLYLSAIGPETKTFLTFRYLDTDEMLDRLTDWPVNLDSQRREYFRSKQKLRRHLTRHRNELSIQNDIFQETDFYSDINRVFVRWLYDAIAESRYGTVWQTLIAYQKVVAAKENLGIERALGTAYFSQGQFITEQRCQILANQSKSCEDSADQAYIAFNRQYHIYKQNIATALQFAPFITESKGEFQQLNVLQSEDSDVLHAVKSYRRIIQNRAIERPSLKNATRYYDNMSLLIDEHLTIQEAIRGRFMEKLDLQSRDMTTGVAISAVVILLVILMCPALIQTVRRLTDNIQSYALTLASKMKELNQEKRRTESLLYQMLPKPVAEQLKMKRNVTAEFYKEVTIFFSDIVGFTRMTGQCTPMQVVNMLNDIYTLFDQRIEIYDVYKVETIGDSYMVASGVPSRNGNRHVTEIANLSLDLLGTCSDVDMPLMEDRRLRIRVGIHSGQCVAGVVGLQMPRYCLFGDSVNTASRMETTSLADRIHCSAATYRLLNKTGGYVFQCRGGINVKGKGIMTTYFLMGHSVSPVHKADDEMRSSNESYTPYYRRKNVSRSRPQDSTGSREKPDIIPTSCGSESTVTAAAAAKTVDKITEDSANGDNIANVTPDETSQAIKPFNELASRSQDEPTTAGACADDNEQLPAGDQDEGALSVTMTSPSAGMGGETSSPNGGLEETEGGQQGGSVMMPSLGPNVSSSTQPPSYQDLETELTAGDMQSLPVFKLVEGYHF